MTQADAITLETLLDKLDLSKPTMLVMRGLPGSGKSTIAKKILDSLSFHKDDVRARYASADDYFMISGEYRFDALKLSDAHTMCFTQARRGTAQYDDIVIVDNTNTKRAEYTPYVMLARSYGYECLMVHVVAPVHVCIQRNTHGVPDTVIERMAEYFEKRAPHDPVEYVIEAEV